MNKNINRNKLKKFFIKLIAITFAIIIVINTTYNLIFADKLENINKFLSLNKKENREFIKQNLRTEIQEGLDKAKNLLALVKGEEKKVEDVTNSPSDWQDFWEGKTPEDEFENKLGKYGYEYTPYDDQKVPNLPERY